MEITNEEAYHLNNGQAIALKQEHLDNMFAHHSQGVYDGYCFKKQDWQRDTLRVNQEAPQFILNQVKNFNWIKSTEDLDSTGYLMYIQQYYANKGYFFVEDLLTPVDSLIKKYGESSVMPTVWALDDFDGIDGIEFPKYLPDIYYDMVICRKNYEEWNAIPSVDRDGIFYAFENILLLQASEAKVDHVYQKEHYPIAN